jgi:N-acetylmuramoyl-L-alanine amidase
LLELERADSQIGATMLRFVVPVLLWVAFFATPTFCAPNDLSKLPRVELYSSSYVRATDWGNLTGFKPVWIQKGKIIALTNRWWRLEFTADSRRAVFSGTEVWLNVPFAVRDGVPYVSYLDARTTLGPVLFPQKNSHTDRVRVICLDPGHGGEDSGNIVGTAREKIYTLRLAQELRSLLQREGFKIVMTRNDDRIVGLYDRPEIARKAKADLFISLHFNGQAGGRDANGVETYCLTPVGASSTNAGGEGRNSPRSPGNRFDEDNMHLAFHIHRRMQRALQMDDRGVKRARFAVLRQAEMPAVLVEAGFLSNSGDRKLITDPAYIKNIAKAIAEGITAYTREVDGAELKAPTTRNK